MHQRDPPPGTTGCAYTLMGHGNTCLQPDATTHCSLIQQLRGARRYRDVKEPPKAEMGLYAYYTVHVVKAKTIAPQSVGAIGVIAAMEGFVAIEPILDFEQRRC